MAMTEKQGGSDVRANTTRAEPAGDGTCEITGHKWFCSYPPCDIFLTLAQTDAGLACFLIEGSDPGFRIQRLKDKLGTRSLPSSEVEFHGVRGRLVGEEGRGVRTILRMVNHTRLDCLIGSAAGMRWGVAQAVHHARHRSAFGKLLAEQPLMQNVLADLAIESEAATATAMRVARAYDEEDAPFRRFATAVMKYWVCKRAPQHCAGGARVPRRERLRGGVGPPPPRARLSAELDLGGLRQRGRPGRAPGHGQGARGPARLHGRVRARARRRPPPGRAPRPPAAPRWPTPSSRPAAWWRDLAVALQGSLLVRNAPAPVADAFCAGRLQGTIGTFGTLPSGVDAGALVDRALAFRAGV